MPPGKERDERDAGMRNSLHQQGAEHMDDTQLLEQWETIGEMFGYDVYDATEDWWHKFGYIVESRDMRQTVDFQSGIARHSVVSGAPMVV